MGIFLIFLIILVLLWPYIVRLLRRYMAGKAEDMMRRMAGMPSRKEERRRARRGTDASSGSRGNGFHTGSRRHRAPSQDVAAIMKDVAEDVEFTEIREFESESILEESDARRSRRIYREEQVSDAEYTEIHAKRAK